ncbi:MAG: sulfur carrier protein ThiS adenylyltransferase ThiF [Candidatus Ancillula sp.]|jgi:sulfur carrier protein ThiS adenylyltransferase|nr:sulfur carrier protein ThiS adenylyltransferase ThiF [Candidatus Ancillula sp.]
MKLSDLRAKFVYENNAEESKLVSIVDGFAVAQGVDIEVDEQSAVTFIERGVLPDKDKLEALMVSRHTPGVHQKVKHSSVAVCGLGGLGSNIAIALARIGVGKLKLIDFDVVEPSNLNRQQYFISHLGMLKTDALKALIGEINPYIEVETVEAKITRDNAVSLLGDVDIICEAFDNPMAKAELATSFRTEDAFAQKFYVGASGLAGFDSANSIQTGEAAPRMYIAGDLKTAAEPGRGLMAPRVLVAAGHQANMILRLIMGEREA